MNVKLLYDKTNPVIYDNDAHADVYTDELLMALASAGDIDLRGFITTSPVNRYVSHETYELDYAGREAILGKAERSGLIHIPRHCRGPAVPLVKPDSGRIEDTKPIDTEGSRLILTEAKKATPERPLVLIMGGPLTVAADAWLLDPSIADRVVVAWLGGSYEDMNDYNGWVDPWSDYIVASRLKLVQFPVNIGLPQIPKDAFLELPDSELRQWMIDKRLPHVNKLGFSADGDGQPVIAMLNHGYVKAVKRVSVSHWIKGWHDVEIPAYREDPEGQVLLVTEACEGVATGEWWRAMLNPAAWHLQKPALPEKQRPFYALPFPIGSIERIEAEDFDLGGEGAAYHKIWRGHSGVYRISDVDIIPAEDTPGGYNNGAGGGYCVTGLQAGEWLEYCINIEREGVYDIGVRAASKGYGGSFHLEFGGEVATDPVEIPDTAGALRWETLALKGVRLQEGIQVMRLVVERNGENGCLGAVNYFQFKSGI